MAEQTKEVFTQAKLIICEGESDCRFLDALFVRRNVSGYQLVKPAKGKTGFEDRLRTIRANDDFKKIEAIILVTDNDDEPGSSFDRITGQIRQARRYPVPANPLEIAKTRNCPAIAIVMLPWTGREGGMENLVLESLSAKEAKVWECLSSTLSNHAA